jgi:hypothetical protein
VVARVVRETHDSYLAHPTREFVPILVEDAARDRLHRLTRPVRSPVFSPRRTCQW